MIPKSKYMFLYMCDFYLLFSAAWIRAIRDTFIQGVGR